MQQDELFTLTRGSQLTGLTVHALRNMLLDGRLVGYQPGGPNGKYLVPRRELERIMRPVEAK